MDKVQKIREEVEKLKLCTMDEHMKFYSESAEAEYYVLCKVEEIIDSLQEEPVSEGLGEYINELSKQFPEVSFAKLSRIAVRVAKWQKGQDQSTIELAEDHAMLAGMNKMEQQLIAKAIDATCFGFQGAALFSFRLPADNYLVGSKVKVIVIKED